MKISCLLLTSAVLLTHGLSAQTSSNLLGGIKAVGGHVTDKLGGTATVEARDVEKRLMTLRLSNGDGFSFIAGPDLRAFDTLKIGDRLNVDVSEEVSFYVTEAQPEPDRVDSVDGVRVPDGKKAGAFIERKIVGFAVIDALDAAKRKVTLRGPRRTVEVEVSPEAVNFNDLKVGDRVAIEFVQSILVAVQ